MNQEITVKSYKFSIIQLNKIVNYLSSKPYNEVAEIVNDIINTVRMQDMQPELPTYPLEEKQENK